MNERSNSPSIQTEKVDSSGSIPKHILLELPREQHADYTTWLLDSAETREAEKNRLAQLATTDELTHLANKRALREELQSVDRREASEAVAEPIGCLLIDLDHFKEVNDQLGHDKGDETLQVFAGHLKNAFRDEDDILSRSGGDEFTVVAKGMNERLLRERADIIRKIGEQMCKEDVKLASVKFGVSVGWGLLDPEIHESVVEALKIADEHMYKDKEKHHLAEKALQAA